MLNLGSFGPRRGLMGFSAVFDLERGDDPSRSLMRALLPSLIKIGCLDYIPKLNQKIDLVGFGIEYYGLHFLMQNGLGRYRTIWKA